MTTPTGTDPHHAPVPPGWPGDDPTVPEELDVLGERRGRARRPAHDDARPGDPPASVADGHIGGAAGREGTAASDDRGPRVEPDDDQRRDDLDDDELDVIAGVQPAGRVLVIMVAALVLAMLVNADALVERAERKPPGASRDRSLAVWHPVQDVSHVLQLYRVRQLADWVAGDDDAPTSGPPESARDSRRAPGSGASPDDSPRDGAGTAAGERAAPTAPRSPCARPPQRSRCVCGSVATSRPRCSASR